MLTVVGKMADGEVCVRGKETEIHGDDFRVPAVAAVSAESRTATYSSRGKTETTL